MGGVRKKAVFAIAAIGFLGVAATQASAATLTFEATGLSGAEVSDFSIVFDDLDSDGLLGIDEVVSFSGVTLDSGSPSVFDELRQVADVLGLTDPGLSDFWGFSNSMDSATSGTASTLWTYEITGMAVVPLPAALPLLLVGLGALGSVRRRRVKSGLPQPAV